MAGKLGEVRDQVTQAYRLSAVWSTRSGYLQNLFGGGKTLGELEGAEKLVNSMRALGDAIGANANFVANNSEWASPVLEALDNSPICRCSSPPA